MNFNIFGKEIFIKKGVIIVSVIIVAVLLGFVGYLIKLRDKPIIFNSNTERSNNAVKDLVSFTPNQKKGVSSTPAPTVILENIRVYITGCVKKPGIVTLKKGQIIYDAVNAAGGLTEEADKNFNMVYVLNENVWINIKSKKEAAQNMNKPSSVDLKVSDSNSKNKSSNNAENNNDAGKAVDLIKDSGGAIVSEKQKSANSKININTASAEELDAALPGVGPKIAEDIVAYRNKNGKFKAITDLVQVPGIGESKFNKLKDYITI
ncbi:MAG: helix-hairpin-helix domain-containing protein [Bacillota bacterium]|nr:helix-hairpin-helix domain-containing protein [Bacillota bacterium]